MRNKLRNRTLAVLLTFMLIIGLMPTTVLAADTATVQINGQILQDGVPVQCGDGTAVLDKTKGTLTLDNATITPEGTNAGIRADNGDLKVILIGENTITSTTQRPFYNSIVDLTIQGTAEDSLIIKTDADGLQADNSTLTIDGCKIDITSTKFGGMMCWGGTLTIQNGANITIDSFENSIMGENGLSITDSAVNATALSNYQDWSTTAVSSNGNISINDSAVTATVNGDAANAIYGAGTISINDSEVEATTTVQNNPYPALCAAGNIEIINHSAATVKSAGTIGIWSSGGKVVIQDSTAQVIANDEREAIQGKNGGAIVMGSWVETFGSTVSSQIECSDSVILLNNEGEANGSLVLPGDVTIGKGVQLSVPKGSSISVPEGVTFTNHGQIELLGDFINNGGKIICDNHAGGTATCTSKAVCGICGVEYGGFSSHEIIKKGVKEATCTKEGYTGDKVCAVCEEILEKGEVVSKLTHNYKDGRCTLCNAIDPDFKPVIIDGANGEWTKGSKDGLSFISNAAFEDFLKVQVDGKDLDASNYTVKEGSTIVTLKAEYLETLSVGKHTLDIVSETGVATTEFSVEADESVETGDDFNMMLLIWTVILAVAGASGTVIYNRKK